MESKHLTKTEILSLKEGDRIEVSKTSHLGEPLTRGNAGTVIGIIETPKRRLLKYKIDNPRRSGRLNKMSSGIKNIFLGEKSMRASGVIFATTNSSGTSTKSVIKIFKL